VYDMPDEIDVQADGPIRIITLNRPDALNAVNDPLHVGLARLWPRLSRDRDARVAVITGAGRAFSAGGDFAYLEELSGNPELRTQTISDGRDIVLGMARLVQATRSTEDDGGTPTDLHSVTLLATDTLNLRE